MFPPGLYRGNVDGVESGHCVARLLVTSLPGGAVSVVLGTPGVGGLREVVGVLRGWQSDEAPMQLHPGDLGWFWGFGTGATAAAVRTWRRNGRIVAIGLLDSPTVLRLTMAPEVRQEEQLALAMVADLQDPARGALVEREAIVEAPDGTLIREVLSGAGWQDDDPWTPLRRDLAGPGEDPGIRIQIVGPEQASIRAAVQRASFDGSTFSVDRWHWMAAGSPYLDARCLLAYDEQGNAVATATVWSAGQGKPGLLEPMGVDRAHRRLGYGRAITVAAANALREMGSSSALVCTPSSNIGAVATYVSAGFERMPQRWDKRRGGA